MFFSKKGSNSLVIIFNFLKSVIIQNNWHCKSFLQQCFCCCFPLQQTWLRFLIYKKPQQDYNSSRFFVHIFKFSFSLMLQTSVVHSLSFLQTIEQIVDLSFMNRRSLFDCHTSEFNQFFVGSHWTPSFFLTLMYFSTYSIKPNFLFCKA